MVIEFKKENLEEKIKEYEKKHYTDQDIVHDLYKQGYTVDSFRYDPERYRWAKQITERHGLD